MPCIYLILCGLFTTLLPASSWAECWGEASARYGVPVPLLKAVAQVESSNRARVIARNTNGSLDYGFMQINDWWLPKLKAYRIGVEELLNPCTSLHVGAWILAQNIRQMGYGWEAIGAYGAGTSPKKVEARRKYAGKVWKALGQVERIEGRKDGMRLAPPVAVPAVAADSMHNGATPVGTPASPETAAEGKRGILVVDLGGEL